MINKYQQEYKETIEAARGELKKPDWLRVRLPSGKNYKDVHQLMRDANLNTVCEEARCPNMGECWNARTATFMILGEICTRNCGFCNVKTGKPPFLDKDEPRRVAESVKKLNLRHAVITSVNRDELDDGGAEIFSETIRLINETSPDCTIEILIPDFLGNESAFEKIMENPPNILNHNLETVPRIYKAVRPQAKYQRSLDLIKWFKDRGLRTKSGIMVGLGEKNSEVFEVMSDLHEHGCDIMTIGQYLQPTKNHLAIDRYVTLEEFEMFSKKGTEIGFLAVESSPLVRSSYHADKHARL